MRLPPPTAGWGWGCGRSRSTITANAQRVEEYHLKRMYPSPNATIRAALDGTVFRAPIVIIVKGIEPLVPSWKAPITVARHAYGDIYKGVEFRHGLPGPGKVTMTMETADGATEDFFPAAGVDTALTQQNESVTKPQRKVTDRG